MVSRARAWPHQRLPRFSVESELRCNIFSCLRKAPLDRLGPAALWSSWNDVVVWVRLNWHVSELALVAMLFEPGFVPFLLLYIAEKGRLLPWKRVWDSGDPLRLCCVLWSRARQLDMSRRRRVREKVERFLRGSGLVCTHLCFVRVPSRGMLALNKIRAVLRDLKSALLRDTAPEVVAFLLSRIRVCQVKPPDLLSSVSSHVSAASNARLASVAEHDDETVAFYRAFRDVAWLPFDMGVQGSACAEDAHEVVSLSLASWCTSIRRPDLAPTVAESSVLHLEPLCHDARLKRLFCLLPPELDHTCLVPLDRDAKRVCVMDTAGYQQRLFESFLDAGTYALTGLTLEEAVDLRRQRAACTLPPSAIRGRAFTASSIPLAYTLYKSKCFDSQHEWSCEKDHKHVREIVACAQDPVSPCLSIGAKCLRLLHKHRAKYSRVLWNQSLLTETLRARLRMLSALPNWQYTCRCGCSKPFVSAVKVDASAFFRSVDRNRCFAKARALIDFARRDGFDGVLQIGRAHV
mgnify:CR=1 FL=1